MPRGLRPRQAAQLAANMHVPVFALDAAPDPAPDQDPGEAAKARETLETIATLATIAQAGIDKSVTASAGHSHLARIHADSRA